MYQLVLPIHLQNFILFLNHGFWQQVSIVLWAVELQSSQWGSLLQVQMHSFGLLCFKLQTSILYWLWPYLTRLLSGVTKAFFTGFWDSTGTGLALILVWEEALPPTGLCQVNKNTEVSESKVQDWVRSMGEIRVSSQWMKWMKLSTKNPGFKSWLHHWLIWANWTLP